ncbi:Two-component system response regulator QseB [Marinobacter nitratireducens]|uniref:Two-component system response regulator QseB n=1 Tax=Marinobacter nitratireducens TaxID=1137280 RepID=A0A072MXR7_9GAMM|nr:Two-component system response regulator QseB [Marinobacter nitratireducens]
MDWLDDGQQALNALLNETFDLAILDLTLPRLDGLEVVKAVRKQGIDTPVIILTARGELDEKLQGLDYGADDYLTKPFAMAELKARIRAVTRRGSAGAVTEGLKIGRLTLNPDTGQLDVGNESAILPRSEFQILQYLMRHPDQVATRRRLEEQLYGWEHGAESNALEVHVHHLRRRVGKQTIRTVRGVGYLLDSEAAANEGAE